MFQIATVPPDQATGPVAEMYAAFPLGMGVPDMARLLSASPGLMERFFGLLGYFRTHPALSAPLLAAIRYTVAAKTGHAACADWNRRTLERMGAGPADLDNLRAGAQETILEDRETAVLRFVLQAVDNPGAATDAGLAPLRAAGYTDADLLDALAHAGTMLTYTLLFKTFARP